MRLVQTVPLVDVKTVLFNEADVATNVVPSNASPSIPVAIPEVLDVQVLVASDAVKILPLPPAITKRFIDPAAYKHLFIAAPIFGVLDVQVDVGSEAENTRPALSQAIHWLLPYATQVMPPVMFIVRDVHVDVGSLAVSSLADEPAAT